MGGGLPKGPTPSSQDVARPLDATPDPDGETIYFTALDPMKGSGVYKVPAKGGASTAVFVGAPFVAPFGIAIGSDGAQLYVADIGSSSGPTDAEDAGQIFVLPVAGGNPTSLNGTAMTKPRSLEVINQNGSDTLYFTGRDNTGALGVFKMAASGGNPAAVAAGSPFIDPSGVTVANNGDVYVADLLPASAQQAVIYKIAAGQNTPTAFVPNVAVGYPVGLTLNKDNTKLFISALDPSTRRDAVIVVDLATNNQMFYTGNGTIDFTAFEEPAGLHRAKDADIFGWADSKAGTLGTVFTINF